MMKRVHQTHTFPLTVMVLNEQLAICRLSADARVPDWINQDLFHSVTRTRQELSVICPEENVPDQIRCEKGWRLLQVKGPLDFSLTGVLASLLSPLAEAGIGVFATSTYDTDYILVKSYDLDKAVRVLGRFCKIEAE